MHGTRQLELRSASEMSSDLGEQIGGVMDTTKYIIFFIALIVLALVIRTVFGG
ncbi:MAG: hypothetical protein GYA42_08905 [Syntrophomonadaceae bacterium]|nr:hypothetical protein [Syntrophomonadaceae bacterium]